MGRPAKEVTRERILALVQRAPGLRLSTLGTRLGLGRWLTRYYVDMLSREGLVRVEKAGAVLRIFPTSPRFEPPQRRLIARLRRPVTLQIVLACLESHEPLTRLDLMDHTGLDIHQVRYQVHRLSATGILVAEGGLVRLKDAAGIARLLPRARPVPEELGEAADAWRTYARKHRLP